MCSCQDTDIDPSKESLFSTLGLSLFSFSFHIFFGEWGGGGGAGQGLTVW